MKQQKRQMDKLKKPKEMITELKTKGYNEEPKVKIFPFSGASNDDIDIWIRQFITSFDVYDTFIQAALVRIGQNSLMDQQEIGCSLRMKYSYMERIC